MNSHLVLTSNRHFSKAARWIINETLPMDVVSQRVLTSPITIKTCRASKYLLHVIMHHKRPAGKRRLANFFLVRPRITGTKHHPEKRVSPASTACVGAEHQHTKDEFRFWRVVLCALSHIWCKQQVLQSVRRCFFTAGKATFLQLSI